MNGQITRKRLIISCIVFAIGLITLLTLCIPLVKADSEIFNILKLQNNSDINTYESGFTLIGFGSGAMYAPWPLIMCILGVLQLLQSLATMVLSIVCIFKFDDSKVNKISRGLVISCISFLVIYMVMGIVFACELFSWYNVRYESRQLVWYMWNGPVGNYFVPTYTLSYIGTIFGCLLLAAYIVCSRVLKNDKVLGAKSAHAAQAKNENIAAEAQAAEEKNVGSAQPQQAADSVYSAKAIADALKEYKGLLDLGIITQEEFDRKKAELLNK